MTRFIRWLLSAWRSLWLGALKLLVLPWRWLARLLGPSGQSLKFEAVKIPPAQPQKDTEATP